MTRQWPGGFGRGTGVVRRADSGQTATEYLGLILIVAGIIAILALAGFGTPISDGIKAAICRIAGGSCAVSESATSHLPPDPCVTGTESVELGADVVVFSVDVGGTGKLTLSREVDPDGVEHWYVQQEGELRVGVDLMAGEEAKLGDLGEGVSGEVRAFLTGAGGAKMEFPTEQAARDFMTAAEHEPIKRSLTQWDPTGLAHWAADQVDGHHYDPPAPTEYFFEGGEKVEGSVDAEAGVAGAGGGGSVAGVVGVSFRPNADGTTNKTVYMKLSADAAGRLGLLNTVGAEGGVEGQVVVGVEYDGSGQAVTASLELAGTLNGQIGLTPPLGGKRTVTEMAGYSPEGRPMGNLGVGGGNEGKVNLTIDLTQGNNRQVVADSLHSVGVPVLLGDGSSDPPGPADGVRNLYGLFDSGAPGTYLAVTTYDSTSSGMGAGLKGGDGLTFGIDGGLRFESSHIDHGYYYQPGVGLVERPACGK